MNSEWKKASRTDAIVSSNNKMSLQTYPISFMVLIFYILTEIWNIKELM